MTNNRVLLFVCVLLVAGGPLASLGQTRRDIAVPIVTVTFTFRASPTGCVGYQDERGGNRFYVELPSSNIPAISISDLESRIEIKKEKSRSNSEITVYSIPFQRGTAPRFGPGITNNQMSLSITPPDEASATGAVPPESPRAVQPSPPPTGAAPTRSDAPRASASPAVPAPGATVVSSTPPAGTPAQTSTPINGLDTTANTIGLANLDLSVPESPAFTVLGVTPQTVVRPTSPREFASALLNGVDKNGNFQSGIALDAVPYLVFAGNQLTLKDYQDHYVQRLLSRTQVSFGTTKGASAADKSLRLAVGLHITLMDKGDPHSDKDLMDCFNRVLQLPKAPDILPPDLLPDTASEADREHAREEWARYEKEKLDLVPLRNSRTEDCRAESRKKLWNSSSWIIAAAPSWVSPTGETQDLVYDGGGAWTSLAYGFEGLRGLEKTSQAIFHARYRNREMVPEPDMAGKFFRQDSLFIGGMFRVGNENSQANFEGVFQRLRRVGMDFKNSSKVSFGLERRIAENIWFNLSFGRATGLDDKPKGFVLTTFKWGFSEKKDPT